MAFNTVPFILPEGLDHTTSTRHGIAEDDVVQNFVARQAIDAFIAVVANG
jgi:hypothetical protein